MNPAELTVIRLPVGRRSRRELDRDAWEQEMERRTSRLEAELLDPLALLRRLFKLLEEGA